MPPTGAVWLRPTLLLRCALAALCVAAPRRAEEAPPLFEQTASRVSGFEGQTVYLPCRVRNLGDRLVSWMRGRDLHILSSGELSFSSDARFRLQHPAGSDAWTLRLERLRGSDAGAYECQVNSEPKAMRRVQLSVRDSPPPPPVDSQDEPSPQRSGVGQAPEPRAAIAGPRERRVQRGSSVSLRCLVSAPRRERPVEAVQWLRDGRPLAPGGAVGVSTAAGLARTLSEATLANVTDADAGNYSCQPAAGRLDSVLLRVQEPDSGPPGVPRPASRAAASERLLPPASLLLLLLLLLCHWRPRATAAAAAAPVLGRRASARVVGRSAVA